jgi:hypothetical protein
MNTKLLVGKYCGIFEKQPLLGNGWVTRNNGKLLEAVFSVLSVLRLYNEDHLCYIRIMTARVQLTKSFWS